MKNTVNPPNFLVWKFFKSVKFPNQEIRWSYGIFSSVLLGFYLKMIFQTLPHIPEHARRFSFRSNEICWVLEHLFLVSFDVAVLYLQMPNQKGMEILSWFLNNMQTITPGKYLKESKETELHWTGPKSFDFCFYLFFLNYCQYFISGTENGH